MEIEIRGHIAPELVLELQHKLGAYIRNLVIQVVPEESDDPTYEEPDGVAWGIYI